MKLGSRNFYVQPPPGGLERAVERGRTLRRRRAVAGTGAAGALAAVLVAVGLVLSGAPSSQSLEFADPSPGATRASEVAASTPPPAPGSAGDSAPASSRHVGAPADCVNIDCDEVTESPAPAGAEQEPGPSRPSYTERPTTTFETQTTCLDAGGQPVDRGATCVMSDSPREVTARAGSEISIPMRLCVASNASGPVTYHFPAGGEHDVRVRTPEGALVWSFAESVRFTGEEHNVQLLPRQCRSYTTTWTLRDQRGRVLPPGDYQVNPRSLATIRGGRTWSEDDKGLPFFQLRITA